MSVLLVGALCVVCSECGGGAALRDDTHDRMVPTGIRDANGVPREPCGTRWTHVQATWLKDGVDAEVAALRPDLTPISIEPVGQLSLLGGAA